jgi:hypothetical protein
MHVASLEAEERSFVALLAVLTRARNFAYLSQVEVALSKTCGDAFVLLQA